MQLASPARRLHLALIVMAKRRLLWWRFLRPAGPGRGSPASPETGAAQLPGSGRGRASRQPASDFERQVRSGGAPSGGCRGNGPTSVSDVLLHCRDQWEVSEGQLIVGGVPITEAVAIAGGTPVFLYERSAIASAIESVRNSLPGVELFYSIKANPFPSVVDYVAELVDGFDVASAGELVKAVCAGKRRSSVQFSGPGKREAEIAQALNARAVIN